jgi:threonine dehydratase
MITLKDVVAARERIQDQIYSSPCAYSETISRMTANRVMFKLDNLQITGSFKERGALNRLLALTPEETKRGVIAASAGNHGMALAFHSQRLGIPSTIVMPVHAPLIKVASVRRYGARAIPYGSDYDSALEEAERIGREEGLTFIHSFDDPWVIAGQGTLGLELHEQCPELDSVVVPVGGGGLIAGVALALKERKPGIRIIGVQAERIPSMKAAMEAGKVLHLPPATTIADGIAVRAVGELPLRIAEKYVDRIVTVSEEEIANAVLLLLEIEKTVAEGAAAVSLAALVNGKIDFKGKNVALIISGGNIDMNLISRIIEKGLIQDGRVIRLSVVVPDRPGHLAALAQSIAKEGANILQIEHVRGFGEISIGETEVELILETTGHEHGQKIHQALERAGFHARVRTS